ncbi:energy-coupling factor ABC transporter ATP-binding protein [Salidesulfovibrio onnuriiensis]|uniref:energy-coupling factor ABC transporter ATP-binding protein n=1 Tax=Salidesulfovibrio onnuriiensis TaxID=2583823 RepID=UPI0011C81349|nr:ABC transporter ATP-binding protein [Salidesulfovibrio onnuriiensis]
MRIEVSDLRYGYSRDRQILNGVSFSAGPGERIALVGRNGAGKTTLAKLCCGLLQPDGGAVSLDGEAVHALPVAQRAQRIGYAFQDPDTQLFARSVAEETAYGPRNIGLEPPAVERAVEQALELTGMKPHRDAHPHELPLALRRMTALAATLSLGCGCLVFDEPTAGLDGPRLEILGNILNHLREQETTSITICHDMDFCARFMDRVLVLHQGRLEEDLPARDFFADQGRLERMGLALPAITKLARDAGLPGTVLHAEEFLSALRRNANRQGYKS